MATGCRGMVGEVVYPAVVVDGVCVCVLGGGGARPLATMVVMDDSLGFGDFCGLQLYRDGWGCALTTMVVADGGRYGKGTHR